MNSRSVADRARGAVRDVWGITQFALMIPVGNVADRATWLLAILIILLPVAWFVVSQPLVLVGRIAT